MQVMQVDAGQQSAGQILWVKTSGHGPTDFRLAAVHAKHRLATSLSRGKNGMRNKSEKDL